MAIVGDESAARRWIRRPSETNVVNPNAWSPSSIAHGPLTSRIDGAANDDSGAGQSEDAWSAYVAHDSDDFRSPFNSRVVDHAVLVRQDKHPVRSTAPALVRVDRAATHFGHDARAQVMMPSLSAMSSTTSIGASVVPDLSPPDSSPDSPNSPVVGASVRSTAALGVSQHRRGDSGSSSLLPSVDISSPSGSTTSYVVAAVPSPVGYTHRLQSGESSWFAQQQLAHMAGTNQVQTYATEDTPSTPPRASARASRAVDNQTPRAIASSSNNSMYRSPSTHSSISSPAASPFVSSRTAPEAQSHAMRSGLSQTSHDSIRSSPTQRIMSASSLAKFDTPSRARFSRLDLNDADSNENYATSPSSGSAIPYDVGLPLADLAEGAVPVQLEATREMEQLLDELGQYLPQAVATSSDNGVNTAVRPPAPIHTVSAPPALNGGTIEINGISLAPEDIALLESTDFDESPRQYPSSAPAWQTTFNLGPSPMPPPLPLPYRHTSGQPQYVSTQHMTSHHQSQQRPNSYHGGYEQASYASPYYLPSGSAAPGPPTVGQRRRRSSIDFTVGYLHPAEVDARQRSTSANPYSSTPAGTYAYGQTFTIPRPESPRVYPPASETEFHTSSVPTTPRRYARVPVRSSYSPGSVMPVTSSTPPRHLPQMHSQQHMEQPVLTRSLSSRVSPTRSNMPNSLTSPRKIARSPTKPTLTHRNTSNDSGSTSSSSTTTTTPTTSSSNLSSLPTSPTKRVAKSKGGGGGGGAGLPMFINYSAQDKKKLLSGVAPSGSSKRRREQDAVKYELASSPN
ncbi:hypothetical protein OIO90_003486 [Microbotryomycetes sp. JL221]|nr:hypothetical protein OIO90_003486 [Microbotryomycetes sp. JL221]